MFGRGLVSFVGRGLRASAYGPGGATAGVFGATGTFGTDVAIDTGEVTPASIGYVYAVSRQRSGVRSITSEIMSTLTQVLTVA